MAIVFMDGFDSWATNGTAIQTLMPRKWGSSGSSNPQNQPVAGRNGVGQALAICADITSPSFTSQSTWTSGFGFYANASYNFGIMRFYDTGTIQLTLHFNVDGHFVIYNGNYSSILATGTINIHQNTWYYFEIKVTIHGTAGAVTTKINGVTDIAITSVNTRASANNTANKIGFIGTVVTWIDDLYLCDTTGAINIDFLGDHKIETILPNAAGNYSQWTPLSGLNYTNVNETYANDDTTYVSTATINNIDTYKSPNLATITSDVRAVNVNMFLRKDNAGSKTVAPLLRIAATDYPGTTVSVVDSYIDSNQIYETNPNTAAAWTVAGVNAAEFGIKLIS